MSLDSALQRVAAIDRALAGATAATALTGGTLAPGGAPASIATPAGVGRSAGGILIQGDTSPANGGPTFAAALAQASGTAAASAPASIGSPGAQLLAAAETQIGQAEQPPGSNESPAIAEYRAATAGAAPGAPWCAYFASWAARQAGSPLGPQGEGLGSVSAIWSWAQGAGRAVPNGPGVTPKPGDLIVFGGEHVGIVRGVLPNGNIQTVEGNYENKVSLNERPPGEATGYVSMS